MHWTQDMLDSEYGYGYRQGVEQGIEKGVQQGRLNARISDVKNIMSSLNLSFDEASKALKLSKTEKDNILCEIHNDSKNN